MSVEIKRKHQLLIEPSIDILREFHASGNEQKFQKTISDLKFLSKVKNGQKINVSTKEFVDESYGGRIYRSYLRGAESKYITLDYVTKIINQSIDQLYFFKSLTDPFYHQLSDIIKKEIINAKKGILALANTYSSFDEYSSKYEAIITSIDVKLQIRHKRSGNDHD